MVNKDVYISMHLVITEYFAMLDKVKNLGFISGSDRSKNLLDVYCPFPKFYSNS